MSASASGARPTRATFHPASRPTPPASCARSATERPSTSCRSRRSLRRCTRASNCPPPATGSLTTLTRPPTSHRSSAATVATATATSATRRSTGKCEGPHPRARRARRRKHPLDVDRSHPDKPGRLGSDRERPRSRPRLQAPRQLPIQPRLGLPRRPELGAMTWAQRVRTVAQHIEPLTLHRNQHVQTTNEVTAVDAEQSRPRRGCLRRRAATGAGQAVAGDRHRSHAQRRCLRIARVPDP